MPKLASSEELSPKVHLDVYRGEKPQDVTWVYTPRPMPKTPGLVLIPPAGGTFVTNPPLVLADRPEHLPYVEAGFVVVAFSMPGIRPENATDAQFLEANADFRAHNAGVDNGKRALMLALSAVPNIDQSRIFSAGHSSSATWSLLFAASEPRIRAAVAYAPIIDVRRRVNPKLQKLLEKKQPGFADFLKWSSPSEHVGDFKVPVFLFNAKDDSIAPYEATKAFAELLKSRGVDATFVSAETGEHYDSMINEGVPAGVKWLSQIPTKDAH